MRNPIIAFETVVQLISNAKLDAEKAAAVIRERQKLKGYALDTRADYAEGAAGAYSMVLSMIAGALGVPDVTTLAQVLGDIAATEAVAGQDGTEFGRSGEPEMDVFEQVVPSDA